MAKEYCNCKVDIVMLNLNEGKAICPICHLERKVLKGSRSDKFLKFAKEIREKNL